MQPSIKTGAAILVAVFASVGAALAQTDAPPPVSPPIGAPISPSIGATVSPPAAAIVPPSAQTVPVAAPASSLAPAAGVSIPAAPMADPAPVTSSVPAAGDPAIASDAAAMQAAPQTEATVNTPAPTETATETPAETPVEAPTEAPKPAVLPHDLTPMGMFLAASPVVQAVMIGLALASVATWTVWLAKSWELRVARRRLREAFAAVEQAHSLAHAAESAGFAKGPAGDMLRAALLEARQSADLPGDGLKERVASRLDRIEAGAARRIAAGTGVLASIGSTAPFVGLFGTVWGIMTSFIGISQAQTTNLAVVAPGIAEALLATAIGLVAAIPAVVIYNVFSRAITGYRGMLGDVSASVQRHVSRDFDRQALPRDRRAAAE